MDDRVLLLWTKSHETYVTEPLWQSDRVIETPENVTSENMEAVATKLSPIIFEEIAKAKSENKQLRIVLLVNQAFNAVLYKVLENHLVPTGGELLHLKIKKKSHEGPTVVLDDATASEAIANKGIIDFDKEPLPDKSIFKDDLPNTLSPPPGYNTQEQ